MIYIAHDCKTVAVTRYHLVIVLRCGVFFLTLLGCEDSVELLG